MIRAALTGQPFEYQGRKMVVTPASTSPQSPLAHDGRQPEAAARPSRPPRARLLRRLGRHRAHRLTTQDECRKVGFEYGFSSVPGRLGFIHVSNDPDATGNGSAPRPARGADVRELATAGAALGGDRRRLHLDGGLKASGVYRVLTPDQCVEIWNEMGDEDTFILHPLMGGIPPGAGVESLHLFEADVLPRVRP